jgi:hypothetical protein
MISRAGHVVWRIGVMLHGRHRTVQTSPCGIARVETCELVALKFNCRDEVMKSIHPPRWRAFPAQAPLRSISLVTDRGQISCDRQTPP